MSARVDRIFNIQSIVLNGHHPTTDFFFFLTITVPLSYGLLLTDKLSRPLLSPMTSVETVSPFLQATVPILQPSHLEGDPTLATEILPGPPSLLSVQQSAVRKDTKKPSFTLSYLPTSDPGSTYSVLGLAHTPTVVSMGVDGPRRKRPRTSKISPMSTLQPRISTRARQANSSAIVANANSHEAATTWSALPQDITVRSSPPPDTDEPMASRSNSVSNLDEATPQAEIRVNGTDRSVTRKDKGKGKEKEKGAANGKAAEEPLAITYNLNEFGPPPANEDHCSSCQSFGSLVYCDGCPRAFHLWCLDPPMEPQDLPEGDKRWFCPACVMQRESSSRSTTQAGIITPLLHQLTSSIPTEFRLPEEIRTHFKDVGTSAKGAYVDTSKIKLPRLNRHGQLEDRDPHRLKDRNGDPILCFRCGLSALPYHDTPVQRKRPRKASQRPVNTEGWKSIVSCDYCDLSWHLDCIDPPLDSMPLFGIKWMCPNHADQVYKSKRRVPKQHAGFIEITKPRQRNNGNIEVVQSDYLTAEEQKVLVDEVTINGRRYRIPERVIRLDFWNRISGIPLENPCDDSTASSPLTSLSSLDDGSEVLDQNLHDRLYSIDDIEAAQVLSAFQTRNVDTPAASERVIQPHYDLESDLSPQPTSTHAIARSDPITNGSRPSKRKVEEEILPEACSSSKSPVSRTAVTQSTSVSTSHRRSSRKPAPSKRLKIEDTGSIDSPLTSISPPPPSKPLRSRSGGNPTPAHSEKSQSVHNDITTSPDDEAKDPNTTTPPLTLPKSVPSSPTKLASLAPSKSESGGTTTSLKIRLPSRANALSSVSATSTTQSTSNTETGNGVKTRKAKR
ncbi:hypothetical protein BDM02DRAFT_2882724 [Thelephora ganbajun]|uniref:Uncharacterized protein n=1 Tax=Thelephora ganbajun TaxID=370292 RepID=A0ACB6ZAZ3_THEGA|nr:hypothetical protein BDM02DRAFT_2882724 [Thelephora ganbajun]